MMKDKARISFDVGETARKRFDTNTIHLEESKQVRIPGMKPIRKLIVDESGKVKFLYLDNN